MLTFLLVVGDIFSSPKNSALISGLPPDIFSSPKNSDFSGLPPEALPTQQDQSFPRVLTGDNFLHQL